MMSLTRRHQLGASARHAPRCLSSGSRVLNVVDAHCEGEPARVITGGVLDVPGKTMFEKMANFRDNHDHIRKLLIREPRGYPAQNIDLILPPTHPDADAGYIIMEHVEYPPMSGHNTICTATVLLETGMLPMTEPITEITLESPAGLIKIKANCSGGKVQRVTFKNQPSFAAHLDASIDVPELGKVTVDVAYGGMWYAICEVEEQLGVQLLPENGAKLARYGEMIKTAAREQLPVVHPLNDEIAGVSIIVLRGKPRTGGATSKNVVIVSTGDFDWDRPETWTGAIDRSPCGTGTCATMAALHAKGELRVGDEFVHEGILNTCFHGFVEEECAVGPHSGIVASVGGRAWITQYCNVVLDPSDPFPEGYTMGDIWA